MIQVDLVRIGELDAFNIFVGGVIQQNLKGQYFERQKQVMLIRPVSEAALAAIKKATDEHANVSFPPPEIPEEYER